MTSPDSQQPSSPDLQQIAAAFAVERQVLAPELSLSLAEQPLSCPAEIEDKERIAAGLLLCLSLAIGQTIGDVKIERLDRIDPAGRNQGLIDFKLVCLLPTQIQIHLGICVLPCLEARIVNEACTRLLVYKDFGLDRLCLLGQSSIDRSLGCLPKLLSADIGGHFIPLTSPDLLTILTTLSVFQHKQEHGVTNQLLSAYLVQAELLTKNELINSILVAAQS
jgi:hypothetical protein